MSFHLTARDIEVVEGHILKAELQDEHGAYHEQEFDLNQAIGNIHGKFTWGAKDFSHSAQNVTFHIEGEAGVPVLRAELDEDNTRSPNINLSEHIENVGGKFQYKAEC